MTKKLVTLIAAGLMLMAVGFDVKAEAPSAAGRNAMKHARFGIRMAERNLFPAHMLLKFKDEIGLTRDQVNTFEKMREQFMEYAIKQRADLKIKEMKFHSFLKEEKVNRKKMEKMIREIAGMKTDMQISHMNYLLDIKEVLTPEQIQQIEKFKKERRHKRLKERRHRIKERVRQRVKEHKGDI
jgi:Spy/CpxP family protein refolding chaperone